VTREWERRNFLKSITLGTTVLSIPQRFLGSQQLAEEVSKQNVSGRPQAADAEDYDGKVYGIFDPLKVSETATAITIAGGTFAYVIDRATGQFISVRALGDEFIVPGTSFPNPYIGLLPEDDPGARREGGKDRPRFGYEKSAEIRPLLWSGGLTGAHRFEAVNGTDIHTELLHADPDSVRVRARGKYRGTPLLWTIDYLVDVDGFTKVTVSVTTTRQVKLRWNCFNHAFLSKKSIQYFTKVTDPGKPPTQVVTGATVSIGDVGEDEPVLESHWNAFFRLANRVSGIEFSKQDFQDRYGGYRDSAVVLEDGSKIDTGTVETRNGRKLRGWDSRGKNDIFTQIYERNRGLEVEEFEIRNATYPLNPGDVRKRVFWMQATPAKHPRNDLNYSRVIWPGPHQIVMTGWRGTQKPWVPPSDELVKFWAQIGVNLIVGGADYWSGDYARPLEPEKTKHFLKTAHRYGIKVIPYVTFSDYNFAAPGYQEHAAEWMSSESIEFANETTLMCFDAKGWRDRLERQWEELLSNFDFDGLYIDQWFRTRLCWNSRHGCGGYLGSFATEGYHDFAKRARRVVAKHTDGKGIILLNANMLLFSGVVPWVDIRLNGENDDPRKMTEETLATTWNGFGQGVQTLGIWGHGQDSAATINLLTTLMMPFPMHPSQFIKDWDYSANRPSSIAKALEAWQNPGSVRLARAREIWNITRFFDVNCAEKISSLEASNVLQLTQPGSIVNAFVRDGRALVVMGVKDGNGVQQERLHILAPERLGLRRGVRYRLIDLRKKRYLIRNQAVSDLAEVAVQLVNDEPLILLLEPERTGPQLVYFGGADQVTEVAPLQFRVKAVPGAPLELYLDTAGQKIHALTPGFEQKRAGDFIAFEGVVPEDQVVKFGK
jgi:Domain of unknown function (DUF6259)